LTTGHIAYCHIFGILSARVGLPKGIPILPAGPSQSRTAQETTQLALKAFGPGHWAASAKLRYYDTHRGYWIFARDYERQADGKHWEFRPVAVILRSRGGATLRTISGQSALVEFNRAFDMSRPGSEPTKVVRARIQGQVQLRDDRGTSGDIADDLVIGPMDYVTFDDASKQITSESKVELRDRSLVASGVGLQIDLLERSESTTHSLAGGYEGARTIKVMRDIQVEVQDVGSSGIVPGASRPRTDRDAQAPPREPRPGVLRHDGPMRIDLPAARPQPTIGPPAPASPIHVHCARNVRLRQGTQDPDSLDCDNLFLTLVPDPEKENAPPRGEGAGPPSGPLDGLVLQTAKATGHAVFLQSPSQGLDAQGNEMIYNRLDQGRAKIYFRGDRKTVVNRSNYQSRDGVRGPLDSVDKIETVDITLHQEEPNTSASIVARGPGRLETRRARDQAIERTASWNDRLVMTPIEPGDRPRRRITITGAPELASVTQGKLKAQDSIVALLRPRDPSFVPSDTADPAKPAAGQSSTDSSEYTIEWVTAKKAVEMTSYGTGEKVEAGKAKLQGPRTITARDQLDVVFLESNGTGSFVAVEPGASGTPASPRPVPRPADAEPKETATANPPTQTDTTKPKSPALKVEAGYVWASVVAEPRGTKSSMDVREVRLRRSVTVHQDPKPGEARGLDANAEELDLKLAPDGTAYVIAHGDERALAKVSSDENELEGMKITLDQAAEKASVDGPGQLVSRRAGRTLVPTVMQRESTEGQVGTTTAPQASDPTPSTPANPNPPARTPAKSPLVVTWSKGMRLHGRHPEARGAGRAVFEGTTPVPAVARTDDGSMIGELLVVDFDRPLPLKEGLGPRVEGADSDGDPQILEVRGRGGVVIENQKFDPRTKRRIERRVVQGPSVTYRRRTGTFECVGAGQVRIYRPSKSGTPGAAESNLAQRPVATIANSRPDEKSATRTARAPGIELLQIDYRKEMNGKFDAIAEGADPKKPARGKATFRGDVMAISAPVPDWQTTLDPDRPPRGFRTLSAQKLDVHSEPTVRAKEQTDRILVAASENPIAFDDQKSIKGDRITYDSFNDLFYVYGDENGVLITDQNGEGQPYSSAQGSLVCYNVKTGKLLLLDPVNFQVIDSGSGARARTASPAPPPRRETPKRRPSRPIGPNDRERAGFGGR
jgi:lipopolysaccharide export system protein LptA